MQQPATESKGNEKGYRQRGAVDRDLFCPRLDAYLGGSAAAHGLRGTLASLQSAIERGGVGGGGDDPNIAMLMRVGAFRSGPGIAQHRESERRFRLLVSRHQATHLAHYLGTSRAHATLRANFGDLDGGGVAGVVLYRWQLKQAKARQRDANVGFGQVATVLDPLANEIGALERELAACREVLNAPVVLPAQGARPARPDVPLVIRRRLIQEALSGYHRALREWSEPVRKARAAATQRRLVAESRRYDLEEQLEPLRAQRALLASQQAAIAAVGDETDDEQALVDLCRRGVPVDDKKRMVEAAEADVRAAHRAWQTTGKKVAKAWADDCDEERGQVAPATEATA